MDKMRRYPIATAPVNLHGEASKQARLLRELDQAETWIRAEKQRIAKRREKEQTKYAIAVNLGPQTTLATKVEHATRSILADWDWTSEGPKLFKALRLIRKLRAVIQAGVELRENSDEELAFVRQVVNHGAKAAREEIVR